MSDSQNSKRSKSHPRIYSINEMAEIARVSIAFIRECERENLIQLTIVHGTKGYGHETVRRLIRIRHLQRDLGLDLTAIDCILRMRRQIENLQKQMRDMERRMLSREQEMTTEVQRLRKQLAQDCHWKNM